MVYEKLPDNSIDLIIANPFNKEAENNQNLVMVIHFKVITNGINLGLRNLKEY